MADRKDSGLASLRPAEHPGVGALFDRGEPNHPGLFAALAGRTPCRLLVDDPSAPREALLHLDYGFAYASRAASPAFLERCIAQLRPRGAVTLIWGADRLCAPPAHADEVVARIEYAERRPRSDVARLPDGYELLPMDEDLLGRCAWRGEVERAHGSIQEFLRYGGGWCVVERGRVLSEAYAFFESRGVCEIGAITSASVRRRGLAGAACARLIRSLERDGLSAYWTCNATNRASIKLAMTLGFRSPRPYAFHVHR